MIPLQPVSAKAMCAPVPLPGELTFGEPKQEAAFSRQPLPPPWPLCSVTAPGIGLLMALLHSPLPCLQSHVLPCAVTDSWPLSPASLPRCAVLECTHVSSIDYTVVVGLSELLEDFQKRGVSLAFVGLQVGEATSEEGPQPSLWLWAIVTPVDRYYCMYTLPSCKECTCKRLRQES